MGVDHLPWSFLCQSLLWQFVSPHGNRWFIHHPPSWILLNWPVISSELIIDVYIPPSAHTLDHSSELVVDIYIYSSDCLGLWDESPWCHACRGGASAAQRRRQDDYYGLWWLRPVIGGGDRLADQPHVWLLTARLHIKHRPRRRGYRFNTKGRLSSKILARNKT